MSRTPLTISATDLIRSYSHESIQHMARKRGIEAKGRTKGVLIAPVARTLYHPDAIASALNDLEPVERHVLDRLILMGGETLTTALRHQLQSEGKVKPPERNRYGTYDAPRGSPSIRGSDKFEDIVARLGALGLVFTIDISPYNKNVDLATPGPYLFIPTGVMKHLPQVTLTLETVETGGLEEKSADPQALLRDLYVLASFALDEPIPLTVRDQIPKRMLVRINESLRLPEDVAPARSESDLGRLPFMRALAEDLGLLAHGAGALRLGEAAPDFLSRPPGERRRKLYDTYRESRRWSELTRIPGVAIWPKERLYDPAIVAARKRVLAEIAELPADRWISAAHLIDRLRVRAYEFLLPRTWRSSYYYGSSYYNEPNPYSGGNNLGLTFQSASSQAVTWETVEANFIRSVATEALHWLGIVDLASADDGTPSAFRITEEGKVLLQGKTPPSPPAEPHVVIQPNFQILVFEPTGEDVLFTLDRLAKRVRAEQVVEYHLTRESVYAAQRAGMDTEAILAFLDRVSSVPLPQNVRRSLEEWGAQHDRIVVRRSTPVIHAVDEKTLDDLYADPELSRLLGRRLAPTVALVPIEHLQAVSTRLVSGGRGACRHPLPALSEGNDAWKSPALVADAGGAITFRQQLPSVYMVHALRPFADEEEDGTLRLTPGSLRRGARAKLSAEDMIATLERYHIGPLPEEVAAMVRRWAKDWGSGALAEVVLLQVESAETMAGLLADPELRPYLQPLPGVETLATVRRDKVEQVRSLLDARGMDLRDRLT